jgi:sugar phosphate isomerase/epimerase
MANPVGLVTGPWADVPLDELAARCAAWGFDGLELACAGGHVSVERVLGEDGYAEELLATLARHGLSCVALSNHNVGQAVCDAVLEERHRRILPAHVWGDGEPEGVRARAAEEMRRTARAAARLGVPHVVGFTGSAIWHRFYPFPPVEPAEVEAGYRDFAARWGPILDVFEAEGVRFALEVHPGEIAYDFWTTARALEAIGDRAGFGLNFDPSHLIWQCVDSVAFVEAYGPRIVHVHVKDAAVRLDRRNGILASHLPLGDPRRGWDFRTPGRGDGRWDEIFAALARAGYEGPLCVEWEDEEVDRDESARAGLALVRRHRGPDMSR